MTDPWLTMSGAEIDEALASDDWKTRFDAVRRPDVTLAQLDVAIADPHELVRGQALWNSNSTQAHVDIAPAGDSDSVRNAARIPQQRLRLRRIGL